MSADGSEYPSVKLSVVYEFISALGYGDNEERVTKVRIDAHVVTMTILRIDERGRYFVDSQTGRPAEEYVVMPVVR